MASLEETVKVRHVDDRSACALFLTTHDRVSKAYIDQEWRNGSLRYGGLESDVDMKLQSRIDVLKRFVCEPDMGEDACHDHVKIDGHVWHQPVHDQRNGRSNRLEIVS